MVRVTISGTPVIPQILGGNADLMAETARRLVALGAPGIDINFGCPAPTVNRHDGGATLLKFPHRIKAIVSAVKSAVPEGVTVSAKLRLGWDDPGAIDLNAQMAAEGGADWITIHGRTKLNGYTPPAYWLPIGRVKRSLGIPVIANGEIWTLDDYKRCQDESGCEHIMIGRGALACPELASHIKGTDKHFASWSALLGSMRTTLTKFQANERRTVARLKQWMKMASSHGDFCFFDQLKRLDSAGRFT